MGSNSIAARIVSYEPLMHRVLKDYHVKKDYDDFMQEMRISTWNALIDENPDTMYLEDSNAQFTTYLYHVLANRVKDILKVRYKIKLTKDDNRKEVTVDEQLQKNLVNPSFYEELSYEQQLNAVKSSTDANSIRMSADMATFVATLSELDQEIWRLKLESRNIGEIADILKENGIANKDRRTISRHIDKIFIKFKSFMDKGDYNG